MGLRLAISGRVQGVGFRAWMVREATALGVAGWVRNRPDGGVEALLEGAPDAVATLARRARSGPPHARVDRVLETPEPSPPGPPPAGFSRRD